MTEKTLEEISTERFETTIRKIEDVTRECKMMQNFQFKILETTLEEKNLIKDIKFILLQIKSMMEKK